MAYSEELANRVREGLAHLRQVDERIIFQGLCFMVNGKMCICVRDDEMMCRIGPEAYPDALEHHGCRPMIHRGRTMKGFIYVGPEGYLTTEKFNHWVQLSLAFNNEAKAAPKRKKVSF